jgi:hypothetical protein
VIVEAFGLGEYPDTWTYGEQIRSVSKGREYERIWIYVPTRVSDDTAFPFKVGDPCLVQLDNERRQLIVRKIGRDEAVRLGWRERKRRTG